MSARVVVAGWFAGTDSPERMSFTLATSFDLLDDHAEQLEEHRARPGEGERHDVFLDRRALRVDRDELARREPDRPALEPQASPMKPPPVIRSVPASSIWFTSVFAVSFSGLSR
jgi:hypothetical protein